MANAKIEERTKSVRKTQQKGFCVRRVTGILLLHFFHNTVVKRISRRQCLQSHTLIYAVAKGKTRVFSFTFPIPLP